jgi:hypothetical protein
MAAQEPAAGRNHFETQSMLRWSLAAASILVAAGVHSTVYAAGETAQADAARKKSLQRCDQLKDKAELDCLQKARERIVEARQKRENAEKKPADAARSTIPGDAAQKK